MQPWISPRAALAGSLFLASLTTLHAAPAPTHHYEFEGDVTDSAGTADGVLNNFPASPYTTGTVGAQALSFDGVDDYVALPVFYTNAGAAVSVSAWIKTSSSVNQIIASADRNEYWRLEINGSAATGIPGGGGPGQIGWDVMTNAGQVDFGAPTRVDDGQWHHVAGTFDGATGTMRIYIDGFLDAETVDAARTTYGTGNDRYPFIGRGSEAATFNGTTGPNDEFSGDIDDVRIYNNVVLSPQDVQELALAGRGQVNFLELPLSKYSNFADLGSVTLDANGSGVVDGNSITITGNSSKKLPWQYSVTPNTILEFEIDQANAAAILVGLDEDNDHTQLVADGTSPSPRLLAFHGVSSPTADILVAPEQADATPGFQRFQLCLGRYWQGDTEFLTFVTTGGATVTIRSMRIFETDTFEKWAMELPIGQRGPNDDPDGDGQENLLEYSLGAPPIAGVDAACSVETIEVTEVAGKLQLKMAHTQKPDVVYVIEASETLGASDWVPADLKYKTAPWEALPGGTDQTLSSYLLGAQADFDTTSPAPTRRFVRVATILYGDADDLDGDLMADHWEFQNALDPGDPADAALDNDATGGPDGLTNLQEFQNGGDPNAFDPAVVSLELIEADAFELEGSPARLRIKRAGSDLPETIFYTINPGGVANHGAPGAGSDFNATIDAAAATGMIFMGDGDFEKEIVFQPVLDSENEYPEGIEVTLDPPGGANYSLGAQTLQNVFICDAADTPDNETLFLGFYRPELDSVTSADGIATVRLSGSKRSATVTSSFGGMQTNQTASHVHSADPFNPDGARGPVIESLELGQIETSPHTWAIVPAQGWTGQDLINALYQNPDSALKPPHMYTNVHSANYTAGEIWAKLVLVTGAAGLTQEDIDRYENPQGVDLNPVDGFDDYSGQPLRVDAFGNDGYDDPPADDPGTTELNENEHWLKREVVRFLQAATFGPTPAEVDALYNEIITTHGGDRKAAFKAWMDAQLALDQSSLRELAWYLDEQEFELRAQVDNDNDGNITSRLLPDAGDQPFGGNFRRAWWTQMIQCHDQLLQRYILALSEICVISTEDATLGARSVVMGNYWDMLGRAVNGEIDTINASGDLVTQSVDGTYRNILEAVSKSPAMGIYLSHLKNELAQDVSNPPDGILDIFPDENYAREIMQLFSFGLVHLLQDGKVQLGTDGLPIATYTNDDIKELSRVFTGWSFSYYHTGRNANPPYEIIKNNSFTRGNGSQYYTATYEFPMKNFAAFHDTDEKNFLGGTVSAGLNGENDLQAALNIIFGHPSVGPFICYRLLQRMATANPSAGYVYRVTEAFENGTYDTGSGTVGSGSRGDLKAVLYAILLDPEARDVALGDNSATAGKSKEPLVSFGQIVRGFNMRSYIPLTGNFDFTGATGAGVTTNFTLTGIDNINSQFSSTPNAGWPASQSNNFPADATLLRFGNLENSLGQDPMRSPTVFNWFLPDYAPGGSIAAAGITSPELQIATETTVVDRVNLHHALTRNAYGLGGARLVGDRSPSQESNEFRYDSIRFDDLHNPTDPDAVARGQVDINPNDRDLLENLWVAEYNATSGTTQQKRTAAATALINYLDLYFCAGRLRAQYEGAATPNPRSDIIDAVDSASGYLPPGQTGREMLRTAAYLVLTSPDFLTQN